MKRHVSIFVTQHKITPMQRVEGGVAYLTTLSNFFPLEYMVLIINKKQKQQQVSMAEEELFHSENLN